MPESVPSPRFETVRLPDGPDCVAPDGSEIRLLAGSRAGSTCHARLAPGQTARPVRHRSVDEYWFCLAGRGQLWRSHGDREEITELRFGVSIDLPRGTSFQWRNSGAAPLDVLITTIPPWPGDHEADIASGIWEFGGGVE
jgi:mannose-6-phosphate isomerase-like protein (cupin superfamily)